MIKRFEKISGRFIECIYGQQRLAFARSRDVDFEDLQYWAERGGYPGDVLTFHDITNGKVYQLFEVEREVAYGDPAYADGAYYFLRADYGAKKITLYRFVPEEVLEAVTELDYDEVLPANLRIVGDPVHVFSQNDERFECYYPNRFSFALEPHQSVALIDGDRIYLEEWVEEGWDSENDRATEDYKYYHKVIVKDPAGQVLSEEIGFIYPAPDGSFWIA